MTEKDLIGVRVDPETKDRIEAQLEYGDSLSGWVRQAIEERLEREENTEGNRNKALQTAD